MSWTKWAQGTLVVTSLLVFVTHAAAQGLVSKPVRIVVPFSAGGFQYAKEPRVRLLGVTSTKRWASLPSVPTISESGLPGYDFETWYGLLAPAAISRNVVARVNGALDRRLKEPTIVERLAKQSLGPTILSPDEFDRLRRANFEKMAKVVAISGAKVE